MKKLKYFFASAIVLVAVAVSTIVFAEYKEQKGDLRVGNTISNKNVSVNAGSSNLINDGDVKVVKTVSKTDTEGVYNVKFDISAKEKENEKTTPIWATNMMTFGYNIMLAIWLFIGSFTFMPVIFIAKKIAVGLKRTWIAVIFAILLYLGVTFVPILLAFLRN